MSSLTFFVVFEQTWQSRTYQVRAIAVLVAVIVAALFIYLARPTSRRAGIWTIGIIVALFCSAMTPIILDVMPRRLAHLNENNALGVLENLYKAEFQFREKKKRFGTLAELAGEGLVGLPLAQGKTIWGYKFSSSEITDETFCLHADRTENTSGFHDFNITETEEYRSLKSDIKGTVLRGQGQDPFDYSN